jgi:Ca-activated chloride channel family protein
MLVVKRLLCYKYGGYAKMRFLIENWYYLVIFLVVLTGVVFVHFISLKYTKRKALRFANFNAIERVFGTQIISKNLTNLYLMSGVVFFIFLALTQPSIVYTGNVASSNFVLVIDSSSSMLANDFTPNRLAAIKETSINFIDTLKGNAQMGVVSFSGVSFIEQTITNDQQKIKSAISQITTKDIDGTDISGAIITSANLLRSNGMNGGIVVLTDGQTNIGAVEDFYEYAQDMTVYMVVVGTDQGGQFLENITSKATSESLKNILEPVGGKYYNVSSKEDLRRVYGAILPIKKGEITFNFSSICLIIAICLLLAEWILINLKYRTLP